MEVLARLKRSSVKGYHVYKSGISGDTFTCSREPGNAHSNAAIVVKLDHDGRVIGHIPERLAQILKPLLDSGDVERIEGIITGPSRSGQHQREHKLLEED